MTRTVVAPVAVAVVLSSCSGGTGGGKGESVASEPCARAAELKQQMTATDEAQDAAMELVEMYGVQGDDVKMEVAEAAFGVAGGERTRLLKALAEAERDCAAG